MGSLISVETSRIFSCGVGSSSLTRGRTPCIGGVKSWPLDHWEVLTPSSYHFLFYPCLSFIRTFVIDLGSPLDNWRWSHLKVLNLITDVRTSFLKYDIIHRFRGLGWVPIFWGNQHSNLPQESQHPPQCCEPQGISCPGPKWAMRNREMTF